MTFPVILKPAGCLMKGSITDACILKPLTWLSMDKCHTRNQDTLNKYHDQDFRFCYAIPCNKSSFNYSYSFKQFFEN